MNKKLKIRVFGPGCAKCAKTEEIAIEELRKRNLDFTVEKIRDLDKILEAGVFTTPALEIEGEMLFKGQIPSRKELGEWLDKRNALDYGPSQ